MDDAAGQFVRESRSVLSAVAVELGPYVHIYEGTVDGISERVRILALAPGPQNDAVSEAFERVAGEWHNPSSHPNIVTVHERGREPRPWIAVELVNGQPLDAVYADLTLRETRAVLTDVAEAIRNAGLYNTRHGNLVPQHVWVERTQRGASARVGDWGLRRACRLAAGETHLTPFSPPEFVEDSNIQTDQSDVYGLGGLAYYATTGKNPIQPGPSDTDLAAAITAGEITPPTEQNPTLPREIDDVLLQALAYDQRDRQQSAHGFKQAVTRTLPDSNELTIPATTTEQPVQGQQPQPQPGQHPQQAQPRQPSQGRAGQHPQQAQPRQPNGPPAAPPQPGDGYERTGGNRGGTGGTGGERSGSFTRRASLGALGVAAVAIGGWQLFRNRDDSSSASTDEPVAASTDEPAAESTDEPAVESTDEPQSGSTDESDTGSADQNSDTDSGGDSFFELDVIDTNDDTASTETPLKIVVDVINSGEAGDNKPILLEVFDSTGDVVVEEERTVSLDAGESTTVSFEYQPDQSGEYTIQASNVDDLTEVTVSVQEPVTENTVPQGGTLRYGLPEPPDTSNPFTSTSIYADVATMFVTEPLLRQDPETYEWMPWVLDEWELQKRNTDKPEVVLSVRDGSDLEDPLLWNDGEEFTVEDVLFTYQYLNEHEPGALTTYQDYDWAELDDSDEWDIRVKMREPIGTWEEDILGIDVYPKHVWEDVGRDYQSYTPHEEVDVGLTGLGPGVISEYRPDTSMEVDFTEAESGRPDNWEFPLTKLDWYQEHDSLVGNGPHLDRVQYFVYGEEDAMNQALLQGDVDTIYETQEETVEQIRNDDDLALVEGPGSGFNYANWNHRREPLNDICLRQAMSFAWDEVFWVDQLKDETVIDGDIPYTPGYTGVRPEMVFGGELLEDPAVEAFTFRAESDGSPEPDVEGIRSFIENGEIIDGTAGTYVGQEYPGSLSGIRSTYSDARFDYSFGSVESSLLDDEGIDQELYVDGEPVSEFYDHGNTIEALLRPPGDNPDMGEAWFRWAENVRKLGIPMEIKPTAFNEIVNIVPYGADFDMHELGWGGQSSSGGSSYYFFHSDWTNETIGEDGYSYNSSGYGNHTRYDNGTADDLISEARSEFDQDQRQELFATALERVYLDVGYMTYSFPIIHWPLPTWAKGAVQGLVDPPYQSLWTQIMNIYDEREQ